MNERDIINFLKGTGETKPDDLVLGIGDDCAVIDRGDGLCSLVTMDTLVETVHFDTRWHPPEKLGRKAAAVNISDIGAMGGAPRFVFLSLALPPGFDPQWLHGFSSGFKELCSEFNCVLAGGDTVQSTDRIVISVTVIGEAETGRVVYRKNSAVGDDIWVSGYLGHAACGLELCKIGQDREPLFKPLVEAHLDPQPRVELGRKLAGSGSVHAMMDLSDGLATDLAHICEQSGVEAIIDSEKLVVSNILEEGASRVDIDPVELVLSGGEDYELVFTAAAADRTLLEEIALDAGVRLTCVGFVREGQGVKLRQPVTEGGAYRLIDISFSGYDHFRS